MTRHVHRDPLPAPVPAFLWGMCGRWALIFSPISRVIRALNCTGGCGGSDSSRGGAWDKVRAEGQEP